MKILVAAKRVIDYTVQIRVKTDQSGVETANVKMSMNPFDEIAVEEAVRLKEKGNASEIVVVSIGGAANQETLRTALAMGADRAILIDTNEEIQSLAAAKLLHAIVIKESPSLVILGKQAIDSDNNQTGQMLAGLLGWAQGTFVSALSIEHQHTVVTREVDGGLETLSLNLPAVITTDLRLNVPRYLSLPQIMQSKRKPITVIPAQDLSVDVTPRLKVLKVVAPEKRRATVKLNSVKELAEILKSNAQVTV